MVSEKKKRVVNEVGKEIEKYSVIGILDMFKLPSSQLHEIREALRGEAKIRMVKKRLMNMILERSSLKGVGRLNDFLQGEPAFLLSNTDPFRLARKIEKSKSSAPAKPGDIAPKDILIKAGPTSLSAGPVIGELQRVKIPAGVEGEKITIKQDTTIAKEGEAISKEVADILSKLAVRPMEIGLNMVAAWEDGLVYKKDVLFRDPQEYVEELRQAYSGAFNLSLNIGYVTAENVELLLSMAGAEARALAKEAGVVTKDTAPELLSKAGAQAKALKDKAKIEEKPAEEPQKEEAKGGKEPEAGKEEKPAEEKGEESKAGDEENPQSKEPEKKKETE